MATASEMLDQFVELFNEDRLEEVEHKYAPDSFAEEIGTDRRLTPSENTGNGRAWKGAFPDARGTITSKVVDGNRGAAEIVWRGTNTGPLMGHAPTGKSINVRAALFVETNGHQVTRSAHYLDVAGMMAQLGLPYGPPPPR